MADKVEIRAKVSKCDGSGWHELRVNGKLKMSAEEPSYWNTEKAVIRNAKKMAKILKVKFNPRIIYHDC